MGMCRSWRTWVAVGAVVAAVALVAPGARSTLVPLLLLAACPLSMVVMAVGMARGTRDRRPDPGSMGEAEPEMAR